MRGEELFRRGHVDIDEPEQGDFASSSARGGGHEPTIGGTGVHLHLAGTLNLHEAKSGTHEAR
jgi:hypothetical protein